MSRADEMIPAAWTDVLAERRRQVTEEWWTVQHDDKHGRGELACAAGCYAMNAGAPPTVRDQRRAHPGALWPFDLYWWKPTNRRRDLVKAGALILAEIERLDRAAAKDPSHVEG